MFTKAYPLFPILKQMIQVHSLISYFFRIIFNTPLASYQHLEYPTLKGLLL
jgi:hypothetical protein